MNVGILGSGQLAQMLILAGRPLGLEFTVMTPEVTSTTQHLTQHIEASFTDEDALKQLITSCDVITYETENIPKDTLTFFQQHSLHPNASAAITAQDRWLEKSLFTQLNIPTNAYLAIDNSEDLQQAADQLGFPFIVKSRRGGYDGKHQYRIKNNDDLTKLLSESITDAIAEAFVEFNREVSMIAVRDQVGHISFYDICENIHHHGILHKTTVKRQDPAATAAQQYATQLLEYFDYVGILTIEFFDQNGLLLANEMAPRVHNSGHWTIEGTNASQFENHLRAICGLPLGYTTTIGETCMLNLIGDMPNAKDILSIPYCKLHDYSKSPRPKRKLGHVTVFTDDLAKRNESTTQLESLLHSNG